MKSSPKLTIAGVYFKAVARYKWQALGIALFFVLRQCCDLIQPLLFKNFFDTLASPGAGKRPILLGILALIVVLYFFRVVFRFFGDLTNNRFQAKTMNDLVERAFRSLIRHSYQFFSDNFSGSLVRKIQRLAFAFESIADTAIYNVIPLVVTFVGAVIIAWTRSMAIALVIVAGVFAVGIVNYALNVKLNRLRRARAAADSEMTGALSDAVVNSLNIKIFPAFRHEEGLIAKVLNKLKALRVRSWDLQVYVSIAMVLVLTAVQALIIYLAIGGWQAGSLTIGDFVLMQMLMGEIWDTVWGLNGVFRGLGEALADAQEMIDIMNLPYDVKDAPGAAALKVSSGEINFDRAKFSYAKGKQVLDGFSLDIRPREKVALVGSSGAGKSTVVRLLFRFYDLTGGRIMIDGQDIAKVTQESLRDAVSLVPQEPILFHRSLLDNIRYGRRNATDAQVYEAAKKAHCHEFISGLAQGYATLVGERGVKLSGGERQRVAIARAILKDSPILVLDEATSSLDSESEHLIHEALHELMKDKTVIVIAHRLSTIMEMDRIVVLDGGRIVDQGTHASLLKKREGIYKKLWEIQAGSFIA